MNQSIYRLPAPAPARPPHTPHTAHLFTCPPPFAFGRGLRVRQAHLSDRPAPMAGQPAAPQLAISVLAAPPRNAKAEKNAGPYPPKPPNKRTSGASGENSYIHFRTYFLQSGGCATTTQLYAESPQLMSKSIDRQSKQPRRYCLLVSYRFRSLR
jgi:hypothetical protein